MSFQENYRIVVDTNIVVAAGSRWMNTVPPSPDPSKLAQRIIHCVADRHIGLFCGKIIGEYIEKLIDLGHSTDNVTRYIKYLMGAFERVEVVSKVCPHPPTDQDDQIFILCAIDGIAHLLISDDKHLLKLKAHYDPPRIVSSAEASEDFDQNNAWPKSIGVKAESAVPFA